MGNLLDFYKGKKVLITGHTGFKGAWLSQVLIDAGAEVFGYALAPPTKPSLFQILGIAENIHSVKGDIRDSDALSMMIEKANPEIIIHMAAQPLVRESYRNPVYTYEVNVLGTVNILEAARHATNLRSFINVTTDKVYENKEWERGYREDDVLCGFDPYSNSKSCSELVTYSYKNSFFADDDAPAVSTARSGNVIGGGDFAEDRIIPDCIRAVEKRQPVIIRNPASIRPYQHVLECLSGYLVLAKKQYEDKRYAGSYNFGPNDKSCVTTGKLAELFCKAWGSEASCSAKPDSGPHEANFLKLDVSKTTSVLNWRPTWDIALAIEKVVLWEKAYLDGNAETAIGEQIRDFFEG